jgi:hypothetical protein
MSDRFDEAHMGKIISLYTSFWPNELKKFESVTFKNGFVKAWSFAFRAANCSFVEVEDAVVRYALVSRFPPVVSDVVGLVREKRKGNQG